MRPVKTLSSLTTGKEKICLFYSLLQKMFPLYCLKLERGARNSKNLLLRIAKQRKDRFFFNGMHSSKVFSIF